MNRRTGFTLFALLSAAPLPLLAADVCNLPPRFGTSEIANAIVRAACQEHRLWKAPFIDTAGRIASLGPTEAESDNLADDGLIAWQRVALYWRQSGTLNAMGAIAGATSCMGTAGERFTDNDCRAFISDNPWSAAFISWVMTHANVPGFRRSPRHIDYIRASYTPATGASPYQLQDLATNKPAPGDLVCFLRNRRTPLSFDALTQALAGTAALNWPTHCEVVVAANPGGDRSLYLIGGNVANTVMLRRLPLSRTGVIEPPPATENDSIICSLTHEEACNFNRQDWAVLLKLVATSPAPAAPGLAPTETPSPTAAEGTTPAQDSFAR